MRMVWMDVWAARVLTVGTLQVSEVEDVDGTALRSAGEAGAEGGGGLSFWVDGVCGEGGGEGEGEGGGDEGGDVHCDCWVVG